MLKIRRVGKPVTGLILLMAATLVIGACGSDGVGSDEVAAVVQQSVEAAVAAAVPDAASAGPSAAEISAMVQQAVETAAPDEVTAAEIGTMVEAAVAAATEPAVSAAEIESLVTMAVESAASQAATPLSAAEVQTIVAAAIAAIPAPEPMVVAMPTAAPAMEVVVAGATHRTTHENLWSGMEILDPAAATYFAPPIYMLWDRLVSVDLESGRSIPALASSWESNMDATRWTFDLRSGVTFSDGTPVTAADVIYTTQRHLDPDIGSRFRSELAIVDGDMLEMPDDSTVIFNLTAANVDFPLLMTNQVYRIVPDGSVESLPLNGVGTGPFTLESADPDGITVLTAREDYWDGSPLLGRVTVVGIPDADARIAATLAGQIDMVGRATSLTAAQAALFEGDPEFYTQESPRGQIQVMAMITTEPPFDDLRIRKALKMVVDADEMIAVIAQGHGTATCNNPTWPTDQYYLALECPQDIDGARALLAAAHYGDPYEDLVVEFETSNLNPTLIPIATVYKEQAAEAGIIVNINQVPADGYWTNTWMVHPFAASYWTIRPIDNFLSLAFRCGASWNETFWCSEEQDALQDEARAELDFDTRKALYQEAQRILAEEGGMIAPFFTNYIRALNVRLQGVPALAVQWEYPYHLMRIVEP